MGIIAPNRAATPAVKKSIDKSSLRNRAVELLASESEDAEGVSRKEIDQILARALNTAKYAKSDKDATSTAKWLWEIAFGKSPIMVEEKEEELPEIVFKVSSKDRKLLQDAKERGDLEIEDEEVEASKVEIEIEGDEDVIFKVD